jgi:hypothetical protein
LGALSVAFVDESDRRDFRCFAAVVADEIATKNLTDRLNAIVRQASVDYGRPRTSEIHGHPLFHGSGSIGLRSAPAPTPW